MNPLLALGTRVRTLDKYHTAIFKGMAAVALFVFLGKLVSAAKEMAVAYRYGLGAEVDAYHFVFNLVSWPIGVWTSVLTAVLVPLAARIRQLQPHELPRFRAELFGLAVVLGALLALLSWFALEAMLRYKWVDLPLTTHALAAQTLPELLLLLPLSVLVTLQSAWMLSSSRHVNTLLDCVPTFCIGAAVLLFSGGIGPLVWGTVVGAALHLAVLSVAMVRSREIEAPRFSYASPQWKWFWKGFGIMLAGQALMSLTVVIDQFFAADLGTGSIATLSYANRILSLILGLAAIAVSRATLPVFSQAELDGVQKMHRMAKHWAHLMFMLGIAVMLAVYWLAPWAVRLLLERGAFTEQDTAVVAEVLRYALPQLPFYFASMVLVSYALSQRRYFLVFCSGVIGLTGKLVGNVLLVPTFGINGVALAALFVYGANAAFFYLALLRAHPALRADVQD